MNLLQHIAQSRQQLRKSELKVADHVLNDPASVMHSSMAELAHGVGVSEPTIVRFAAFGLAQQRPEPLRQGEV
ncbi:MurR/RpiR family transcriptional regulator, partial [Pseudomonas aeruginosa]|uniref:MurR/RpiR family transcriptional regulator n=1 Tax=Pseudomonas aeruginosa TaxID=287 RepID=UPI00396968B8